MELIHFERLPAFFLSLSCLSLIVIEHFESYYAWKRNRASVFMHSVSQYSPETEKCGVQIDLLLVSKAK